MFFRSAVEHVGGGGGGGGGAVGIVLLMAHSTARTDLQVWQACSKSSR
jgi:hypothetical protein